MIAYEQNNRISTFALYKNLLEIMHQFDYAIHMNLGFYDSDAVLLQEYYDWI